MAQHKSAMKRIRQTERRTAVNRARKTTVKTALKKVEAAIASGKAKAAQEALRAAQPELMRGVSKGAFNKKAASRKMSRLSARVKRLSA